MYVRAHIYQHPLFATRRIVAPRPAAYTDTIVEISITVSPAINPIPRTVRSDTILWLPEPFGSRRNYTRLREARQAYVALIYLRNCLARCCLQNYDNVTISWYNPKESVEPRTNITMQIRRGYCCQSASGLGVHRIYINPHECIAIGIALPCGASTGFVPFLVCRYYRGNCSYRFSVC